MLVETLATLVKMVLEFQLNPAGIPPWSGPDFRADSRWNSAGIIAGIPPEFQRHNRWSPEPFWVESIGIPGMVSMGYKMMVIWWHVSEPFHQRFTIC